jgi:TPR repeat protein
MYNLGVLLAGRNEWLEALKWYQYAAKAGDVDSMFNLAVGLEERGHRAAAEKWYRRAARAGDADAKETIDALQLTRDSLNRPGGQLG